MLKSKKLYKSDIFKIIKNGDGFKLLFLATLLSIIITFFDIKTISLIPKLLESFANDSKNNGSFFFIIFALFSGISRVIFSYISSKINTKISKNISFKVINSIKKIDIYELEKFGISNLSQVLSNDIQNITNELVYPLLQIIISAILSISITFYLLIKIPLITISSSLIYILLYYLFIKSSKRKIRNNSKETIELKTKFTQSASEIVISSRYLKNSVKARKIISFLKEKDEKIKNMSAQNNFLATYPKFISETFGLLTIAFIGVNLSKTGNSDVLSILAILALSIQKIIPSLQSIFVAISSLNCNSANIKRINEFLYLGEKEIKLEKRLKIINQIGSIELIKNNNKIKSDKSLLDVNLSASGDSRKIINFSIIRNKWTAIIGQSGVGKTSFMDLITGIVIPLKKQNLLKTEKGNLKISNNLKNNFIYLSQFNYIPNSPLIEYITNKSKREITRNDINYVEYLLKKSNLFFEFNFSNKDDLFENISENASSISGGQAQRINILRTIYELKFLSKENNILAMDEPFKGLDKESKNRCINLIKDVSKTSILITHSFEEAVEICDYIYRVS